MQKSIFRLNAEFVSLLLAPLFVSFCLKFIFRVCHRSRSHKFNSCFVCVKWKLNGFFLNQEKIVSQSSSKGFKIGNELQDNLVPCRERINDKWFFGCVFWVNFFFFFLALSFLYWVYIYNTVWMLFVYLCVAATNLPYILTKVRNGKKELNPLFLFLFL